MNSKISSIYLLFSPHSMAKKLEQIAEKSTPEQKEILKKLTKSKSTKERVKLFWKIMDTYGVDPIISLIPELGDAWVSIMATTYLLVEWKNMWLKRGDMMKIIWYQSADMLVGTIPLLGDISDMFFKANKRSAKIFEKHFEKLKKEALAKWIEPKEIENIEKQNKVFLWAIHKTLDLKKNPKSA